MFTLKRNYFEEQSLAFIKQFDDMVQCIVALEILDVYRIVFDWDMRDRIEDDASPLGMRCKAKDYILHELMPLPSEFNWYATPHIIYEALPVWGCARIQERRFVSLHLVNPVDACYILGMDYDKYIKEYENSE